MPDVAIVAAEVASTPQNYTLPGAQEILLKAAGCTVNGTAATGAFLPALQMLDPAGHIMWTAVNVSQPVAAGGSALVSWFPGGGIDQGNGSGQGAGSAIRQISSPGGSIAVTNATGPIAGLDVAASPVSAGSYGDSAHVAVFTVGADGRLTAASSVSITGGGTVAGADGWVTDTNSYTFASTSSFTVGAVDLTAVYSPGTRIKLTQTTVKYFVVASSSFGAGTTTVTITGGTDYTLANAAITNPFYSYVDTPQGYPGWFNYTPSTTGWSGTPTTAFQFTVSGRICTVVGTINGTSNATTATSQLPIAVSATAAASSSAPFRATNSGTDDTAPGEATAGAAATSVTFTRQWNVAAWTATGTKAVRNVTFPYAI